jgi:hypothetical protein
LETANVIGVAQWCLATMTIAQKQGVGNRK